MNETISQFKQNLDKVVISLKDELKSIRTGRASPSLVENIIVEAYGGQTKLRLMELATITTEGPSCLTVIPFDPATIADIERAILKSPLGISPATQGGRILIKVPPLSSEQREKFLKLAGAKVEEKKTIIRNHRDNARKVIKIAFENKEISEDEKFRQEKEIDSITQKYMEEVQMVKERKETEIREV